MASKLVHVLMGSNGRAERIFRDRSWRDFPEDRVYITTKAEAVADLREQVCERCRNSDGEMECERCGRYINEFLGEMNEKRPKGKGGGQTGGEVSLQNCEMLCRDCHQTGPDAHHKDRRWQTARISE